MLFDDDLDSEIAAAVQALEDAPEMGVPWPFDPQADLAVVKRIKSKYPEMDVSELIEKFLAWCLDSVPWKGEGGSTQQVRWRSRLWTWARNHERYASSRKPVRNSGRTHRFAEAREHGDASEVVERW